MFPPLTQGALPVAGKWDPADHLRAASRTGRGPGRTRGAQPSWALPESASLSRMLRGTVSLKPLGWMDLGWWLEGPRSQAVLPSLWGLPMCCREWAVVQLWVISSTLLWRRACWHCEQWAWALWLCAPG